MTRKADILIARFPWHGGEHPDVTDWLVQTVLKMKSDERVGKVHFRRIDDTPITMGRNLAARHAQDVGADYVLMIDADMSPDLPGSKPFWDTSWDFACKHEGPCVVAAPYCGAPPVNNVFIFRWANLMNDNPTPDARLEQFSREEAAGRAGFEEVAALPTGLILIDARVFGRLKPPFFYYEWEDERLQHKKASTEDVTFTRDASMAGVPVYVNWDSWAGHWKPYRVDKPRPMTIDDARTNFAQAVIRGAARKSDERLVMVGEGEPEAPAPRFVRRNAVPAMAPLSPPAGATIPALANGK